MMCIKERLLTHSREFAGDKDGDMSRAALSYIEDLEAKIDALRKDRDRRIGYLEECMRQIANIENKMVGGDWDEIEEARRIAIRALGDGK